MTLTTASLNGRAHTGGVTDDDIDPAAKPTRRSFTAEYKAEILAEYDSWPKGSEERGAILRREGLYSSHISEWRKQAEAGAREGLARKSKKRRSAEEVELDRLRRQNERLDPGARQDADGVGDHGKSARALGAALRERGHRDQVEAVTAEHLPRSRR